MHKININNQAHNNSQTLSFVEGKIFDQAIEWSNIDITIARENTEVLELLREACLVESYFAVYTAKMLQLFWYDVEATSMYTIEAFEAYSHFYKLRRYLAHVEYRPITDSEVYEIRLRDLHEEYTDEVKELVNFMGTEHFAEHFFLDLATLTAEPVLKSMLPKMAREERSHAAFAADLLRARMVKDSSIRMRIVECAADFLHVGKYVMPSVRNARKDTVSIIQEFAEKVYELTGESLTEYLANKNSKHAY